MLSSPPFRPIHNTSPQPLPLDVILAIIEHVPFPPAIGLSKWNSEHTALLLLNREIYSAVIAQLYHTVVLRTSNKILGFLDTLGSSPHLGALVKNLWVNHETKVKNEKRSRDRGMNLDARYSVTTNVLAVITLTLNVRRLAISSPLYYGAAHVSNSLPSSIVELVIPSLWLVIAPNVIRKSILSHLPASLKILRIRGRVGSEEARAIVTGSPPALRHVHVRVFGGTLLGDIQRFTSVLIGEHKAILSLELTVLPKQEIDVLSSLRDLAEKCADIDAKVSVRVNGDGGEGELQSWLGGHGSGAPT
ncbi:unnamed protein product [Rhizoctonia solani]|uniref:Uncharacterized protein n=1 Tax=Rhizoctonia solani TaxID=456999 RepID=A0A8H2WR21_9AGAM|nr:unnamed protein product [Rhizoctonia solani]